MKRVAGLLIAVLLAVCFFSCASKWGNYATVGSRTFIRAQPSPEARIVRALTPGDKIRIDFPKGEWAAVFRADEKIRNANKAIGYVYLPHLRHKLPKVPRPPKPLKPIRLPR